MSNNLVDDRMVLECKTGGCRDAATHIDPNVQKKIEMHPCYSMEAHHYFARMHLPVAPACNIQCNYCNRKYDCANESRPGVVSELLSPMEALKKVKAVAMKIPQLSVVGIAGPGDPLANPDRTFKTFELISNEIPELKLCLSTNGLRLKEYMSRIKDLHIDHVTITINCVDEEVGKEIYAWVFYGHKRLKGKEAVSVLLDNQMEGLALLKQAGILCKVNSVMIPGINDKHLSQVAKRVKELGAFLHNVMPVAVSPEYNTHFSRMKIKPPNKKTLKILQDELESDINVMRHCRLCRADAIGLLGEDRNAEFTKEKIMEEEEPFDRGVLLRMRDHIFQIREVDRALRDKINNSYKSYLARKDLEGSLVAVASKGMGLINQHFGHAKEFMIYEIEKDGTLKFVQARKVEPYCSGSMECGDTNNETRLLRTIEAIEDVKAIFVMAIGPNLEDYLQEKGIEVVRSVSSIEEAVSKWIEEKVNQKISLVDAV